MVFLLYRVVYPFGWRFVVMKQESSLSIAE